MARRSLQGLSPAGLHASPGCHPSQCSRWAAVPSWVAVREEVGAGESPWQQAAEQKATQHLLVVQCTDYQGWAQVDACSQPGHLSPPRLLQPFAIISRWGSEVSKGRQMSGSFLKRVCSWQRPAGRQRGSKDHSEERHRTQEQLPLLHIYHKLGNALSTFQTLLLL